jgi:23S rRNA pseudouridine1911/1915/1917 synthase
MGRPRSDAPIFLMDTSQPDSFPNNELVTLQVNADESGTRLDAFLAAHIEGWSRARLQQLIEDAEVLVNGRSAKSSQKLHENDEIEVELVSSPAATFAPEDIPLAIVYEDSDLIVINKPAGLVVHPAAGIHSGTLANALAFHFQQLSRQGGVIRPGIVHRLDKDTSGLLVAAKTELAHEKLADQFRAREVFKSYVALVHGVLEDDQGRIDQPIARDPRNRTRMAVIRAGRGALSLYTTRRRYDRFTLLDVELKTGRTHQIRVHLSWLKHPVVGDEVYGEGRDKTVRDPQVKSQIRKLGRHFLHAEQLGFRHPGTDKAMKFKAPLPVELEELVALLESQVK